MRDYPSIPNVFRVGGSSNSINRFDSNFTENLKNDKRKLSNISGANQLQLQNNVMMMHEGRKYQQQQPQLQQQTSHEQPTTILNTNEKSGGFFLWISTPVAAR